jgi:aryl sulfotransferase
MGAEQPTRVYRHAFLDSRRWERFSPRPGDVVISTSIKAGTTWAQAIVASLLWPDGDAPGPVNELSPWLDQPLHPLDEVLARLEAQRHRRFVKTHLPADALPLHDEVRHLAVGRDGRDVFVSLLHHWAEMQPFVFDVATAVAAEEGLAPMPAYDGDAHAAFARWISTGSFPWEGDGAPWWSHLRNVASWWERRDRPNVLLVHYDDLLADLDGEMRRIAAFLGIEVDEARWPACVERCTFGSMQARSAEVVPEAMAFQDGGARFLHRGTSGQWLDLLTPEEVEAYERRVAEVLPPDGAAWLAAGRLATVDGCAGAGLSPAR